MESHSFHWGKKLKLAVAVALTAALLLSGAGCAKDEVPPTIQIQNEMPEWIVEGEDIILNVNASDDKGVTEVYIQFNDGSKRPLAKIEGETSAWDTTFKLPPGNHTFSVVARDKSNEAKVDKELIVYPQDADGDGIGYRDELKLETDPNKPNPIAKYALDKNLDIYLPQLLSLENDGVVDENDTAFVDLVEKYPKAGELVPGIYAELLLLPDLSMEKYLKIDNNDLVATEKILQLASDPSYKEAFLQMKDEGIPDKRKYCSPLEALTWEAYDNKNLDDLLRQSSLEKLIKDAWTNTSESGNYESERWKNFDEVVDRLNFPEGTYWFTENYFRYVLHDPNIWFTAREFFDKKEGAGIDYATFITYCLLKNGYSNEVNTHETNAVCTVIAIATSPLPIPHGVNAVKNDGKISLFDASHFWNASGAFERHVRGPFESIRDMVKGNVSDYWSPWATCIITSDEPWEANEIILSKYFKEKLKTKSGRETVKLQLLASPWCAKGRNRWIIEELDNYKEGPISDEMFKPPQ